MLVQIMGAACSLFVLYSNWQIGIVTSGGVFSVMKELLKRFIARRRRQSEIETLQREHGLPDAARVAARALVLASVAARGVLERGEDRRSAEDRRRNMCVWLDALGLGQEIEQIEDALVRTAVGQLDQPSAINAAWRSEGMAVLAWALERADLSRYDEEGGSYETAAKLGFCMQRSQTVLARPSLRPLPEFLQGAKTYLTVHWRLREYASHPDVIDFKRYVSRATWDLLSLADVALVEGDLAIRGERIDRVPEDWRELTRSIVRERHKAFNWLLGFAPIYSEVETTT
jgi:hypothetical protein